MKFRPEINIFYSQNSTWKMLLIWVSGQIENGLVQNGISQPLLLTAEEKQQDDDEDQDCDNSEESAEEIQKPVTSIVSAYKLLTPSVKVWISIDIIKYNILC